MQRPVPKASLTDSAPHLVSSASFPPLLRLAVSNVQNGIGTTRGYWHYLATGWKYWLPHGPGPLQTAGTVLREAGVDIAALCEIGGGARRTRGIDQVAFVGETAGLQHRAFFPTFTVGRRVNQGNAVCSRFPLQHVANHRLPGTGEPRFLSEADVVLDGTTLRVFVTHLSLQRLLREQQIGAIADIIGECDQPTVLAGDFNISEAGELDLLLESNLQQVTSAPTFPSWKPAKALDHLFFSRHFTVEASYVLTAPRFADHLPLIAEVWLGT